MDAVVGLRVVRGPDWNITDEESDGGEGFVGTVVKVSDKSSSLPEKVVLVQWDCGIRRDHRVGHHDSYDLCVIDSAPTGKFYRESNLSLYQCKSFPI